MRMHSLLPLLILVFAPVPSRSCEPSQPAAPAADRKPEEKVRSDRYGDPLPAGARARLGTTRLRSLAISPDGKTVAAADEATICLWEHHSGRLLHRFLGRNAPSPSVLFSPDGALLVALENVQPQPILRRWETATGKELPPRPLAQGGSLVAFTPDGKGIVSKGAHQTIHLWDAATGKSIRQFQAPTDHVGHVALSPDGKTLAATGYSSSSRISTAVYRWEVLSGKALPALDGHQEGASCVAFAPDGKTLVVADAKNTYRWGLPGGKLLGRTPRAGGQAPRAFSPDRTILAADDAGGAGLWEVDTGKKLRQLEQPRRGGEDTVSGVDPVFSPDGKTVAGGDYNIRMGPQGSTLGGILLWNTATGKLLHFFEAHAFIVEQVVVSPNGRALASCTTAPGTVAGQEFRLWELTSGKPLHTIPTWSGGLAFTADSQMLISAGERLSAWETSSGKEVARFKAVEDKGVWFASLALAPDGRTLAAGNRLGRASFWDVTTGKALRQLQLHPLHVDGDGERVSSPVMPLVFSPDGRALVFGNDYDQITIASAATGQRLHQFRSRCTARSLALSPDGKTLASTGATNARVIHLWETASGKERLQIGDNRDAFRAVIFSADGKTLISGGQDTIRFWDPATGKEVGQLTGHRGAVTALALLPDGQGFVSGSADTTILVWQGMPRRGEVPGPAKLTGPELEALWADLAGADAGKAYRAIRTLAAAPEQAVPLLRQQLRPVPAPDAKHLARLIADLDDRRFVVRENAVRELEKLGSLASPALREALAGKPSLEVHRRMEGLLERLEAFTFSPEQLRDWRAIEVLERIGTAEARQALEPLGRGAAGARLTEDAKATLQRLAR